MEQFLGSRITDLIHPEDRAASEERITMVQDDGKIAPLRELRIRIRDKTIPVESIGGPVTWEGRSAVQFVIRDISERKTAADELLLKNRLLNSANEELSRLNRELTATQGKLEQNLAALSQREQELSLNEGRLKETLAEKEILLSEIHHRVKNNLTAFISLLSLEGPYEDTPGGQALRLDLQNRARSMALVHETLYRTKKYSQVDMDVYLSTLVNQIAATFPSKKPVNATVNAAGITIDIARATPCGLIVNELMTNAYKHAFPETSVCGKPGSPPCSFQVSFTRNDGYFTLSVSDNGVGLPASVDIRSASSLGLKLVYFLARHQLRATVDVDGTGGTRYVIRFKE